MPTQTAYERTHLAETRKRAAEDLDQTARDMERFLALGNDDFDCPDEIRQHPAVQMILDEWLESIQEAARRLRLQRRCIRCLDVLPEREIRDGYCNKH